MIINSSFQPPARSATRPSGAAPLEEKSPSRARSPWNAALAGLALLGASAYLSPEAVAGPAIPTRAVQAYESLSPEVRRQVAAELNGQSSILWMTVSNRQAFIDGKVGPVNVFSSLKARLDERVEAGELTSEAAAPLRAALQEAEKLTTTQRAALVERFAPAR